MLNTSLAKYYLLAIIGLFLALSSCTPQKEEIVEDVFLPKYNHEAYSYKLRQLGLDKTALGKEWLESAQEAIAHPMTVRIPFRETFYVDEIQTMSASYRITALRGQKVEIELEREQIDTAEIFLDIFRIDNDSLSLYTHIASFNDSLGVLYFEPLNDAEYIVRFQTELLRSGRYTIKILSRPSLAFPVSGKDKRAIGSLFGAPRDAGRRVHHGIDIFSRRHTPITAPCDGYIRSTKDNELGGKVIWLRDRERGQTLYFAHLEDLFVQEDQVVKMGDTIGTVGNSGNAKTTAPHLHFGIYSSGPIDPYHFVVAPKTKFQRSLAKKELIGTTIRTKEITSLKIRNQLRRGPKLQLQKHQIAKVTGTSGAYYKVSLPDNQQGYISYSAIEELKRPIRRIRANEDVAIYNNPLKTAIPLVKPENSPTKVFGIHEDALYLIGENEKTFWAKVSI